MILAMTFFAGTALLGMDGDPIDLISPSEKQAIIEHELQYQPKLPRGRHGYEGLTKKDKKVRDSQKISIYFKEGISLLDALNTLAGIRNYKIRYEKGVVLMRGLGAIEIEGALWGDALDIMAKVAQVVIEDDTASKTLIIRSFQGR